LEGQGAEVVPFDLKKISIKMSQKNKIEFYLNEKLFEFDALFNYGFMSPHAYKGFMQVVEAVEQQGKVCLHSSDVQRALDSKFTQAIKFAKADVPVPDTFASFSIKGVKEVYKSHFGENEKSIVKRLDDYGGDGVFKCDYHDNGIDLFAKYFWAQEYCLIQRFVPDSLCQSVRVLCFNGKAMACIKFEDPSSDFKSNGGYHENFKQQSLEGTGEEHVYYELAEKAVAAIDSDMVICGIDILESKIYGRVVLEINGWPDLPDTSVVPGLDTCEALAKAFIKTICKSKSIKGKP
jgi:glutathione synthase/RimK-type ligase-like ATP-grasp enzyme